MCNHPPIQFNGGTMKSLSKNLFSSLIILCLFISTAYSWPIPDSGQTKCYDNEKEIPCPNPGEPFYGQDGNYNINPASYTKLDENVNELPDAATSWVMVRDNVTVQQPQWQKLKSFSANFTSSHYMIQEDITQPPNIFSKAIATAMVK
jgi:hypothetical protein